jgi:hypothetical protein
MVIYSVKTCRILIEQVVAPVKQKQLTLAIVG